MEKFKASHNKTVFLSTGRFAEEHFKHLPTTTSVSSLSSSSDSSSYSSSYSSSSSPSSSASSSSEDETEHSFSSNDVKQRRTRKDKDGREYPFGGTLPFIGRKRSLNYWDPSWVPDIHEERERRRWQEEAAEKERKWNERQRRKEEKEQRIWEMGQTLFEMKEQEVVEDKEREVDTKRKEEKGGEQEERKKDAKDAKEELHKEKEKKEGDARTNLGKEEKKGRGVHRAFSFRSFNMDRKERRKKKAQTVIDEAERKLLHLPALVEKKPEDDFSTSYVPLVSMSGLVTARRARQSTPPTINNNNKNANASANDKEKVEDKRGIRSSRTKDHLRGLRRSSSFLEGSQSWLDLQEVLSKHKEEEKRKKRIITMKKRTKKNKKNKKKEEGESNNEKKRKGIVVG